MNAILSEKGQITIPKPIREDLGLTAGSVLDFQEENGRIFIRKVIAENPISAWRGKGRLPGGDSVEDYLSKIRDAE